MTDSTSGMKRAPATEVVAVAMSGGLDSSVVAHLLASRAELRVVGLSMLLWDYSGERAHGRCCGALDLGDARLVSGQIGIPHYTLRMDEEFRDQVVDPFVDDYLSGRTPSPCVRCNTLIKFDALLERAESLGASRVATGHYARILEGPEGPELHRALDSEKDQSYFLFELTADQLARSMFPLGEMSKGEVRELARRAGLAVAEKGESMDICFVAGGVQDFVEKQIASRPERFTARFGREAADASGRPAEVVDTAGRTLGRAAPYYRYTVGQRRGLGISAGRRLYVLGVDPARNRVTVGEESELLAAGLRGRELHWIGPHPPSEETEVTVQIRSRHSGVKARVRGLEGGRAEVEFETPQLGVAPGQAAVFYRGSRVLGGCWIEEAMETQAGPRAVSSEVVVS